MSALVRSTGRAVDRFFPAFGLRLRSLKYRMGQVRKALLHAADARINLRHMDWRTKRNLQIIESELIFQYHKIEKGLCMPPPRRFFGVEPAKKTTELIQEWERQGGTLEAPAYLGAIEAMRAYRDALEVNPPPPEVAKWLRPMLDRLLSTRKPAGDAFITPIQPQPTPATAETVFATLMQARRSVRHFKPDPVPLNLIEQCVNIAQWSPSACNRQPWKVHAYTQKEQIKSMLKLQNGNTGFGHQLQTLLVITSDRTSFFDATERNEPYVDGGLFAMSLLLALQSHGISSCCLNWCVDAQTDKKAHAAGCIAEQEAIIMYLAIGYADTAATVPRSIRKSSRATLLVHD